MKRAVGVERASGTSDLGAPGQGIGGSGYGSQWGDREGVVKNKGHWGSREGRTFWSRDTYFGKGQGGANGPTGEAELGTLT